MFLTSDPWLEYLYEGIEIPKGIDIPADDVCAYPVAIKNGLDWIYNKIRLCRSQGIEAYPSGVDPKRFPIVVKPITNLYGLSGGVEVVDRNSMPDGSWSWENHKPGYFWMYPISGVQRTSDVAISGGDIEWVYTMRSVLKGKDPFRFHYFETEEDLGVDYLPEAVTSWILKNFSNYFGVINIEYIGDKIIDAHLRFSDQFLDFYGRVDWLTEVAKLSCGLPCRFNSLKQRAGCSLPVYSDYSDAIYMNRMPKNSSADLPEGIFSVIPMMSVSPDKLDGNNRLAIVNGENIFACESFAKEIIKREWFRRIN